MVLVTWTENDEPMAITSITSTEFLVGAHCADSPLRRLRREAFVESILEVTPVLPFDPWAARIHAHIWIRLLAEGQAIRALDILIVAIVMPHGYALLNDHVRELLRILGVEVYHRHH